MKLKQSKKKILSKYSNKKNLFSRILNENKTVYQLYKDLVISGLVTADDFWSKYVDVDISIKIFSQYKIYFVFFFKFDKLTESTKKQNTGVSGAFLV